MNQQPLVLVGGRALRLEPAPGPAQLQAITIGPAQLNIALPGLLGRLLQGNPSGTYSSQFRYFGPITALMTVRESGTDTLQITQHPVAIGAQITDHSFMDPARLDLTMMTTNAQPQSWGEDYVSHVYKQLLDLQASRMTFPIQTGKRLYENMLMTSLTLSTDATTEHALMLSISCQEIIMVQNNPLAPSASQAAPQKTDGILQGGPRQPQVTSIVPQNVVLAPPVTFP